MTAIDTLLATERTPTNFDGIVELPPGVDAAVINQKARTTTTAIGARNVAIPL
jgi:hypothetical protein